MTTAFERWAARHPDAAKDLMTSVINVPPVEAPALATPEAYAMQAAELAIANMGGLPMRNNVGATPSKCRSCGAPQTPVRYGVMNKTKAMNTQLKSPDILAIVPRYIVPSDVGLTIGQFVGVEVKAAGWRYSGRGRETAQAACLTLFEQYGARATFSTGEVQKWF